jgi:flagella basal body P-ring formation protein FlgA
VDVRVGQEILSISMKGIAQQNGYVGDIVKVRSTGNQKTITGRLVSRGLVQVEL